MLVPKKYDLDITIMLTCAFVIEWNSLQKRPPHNKDFWTFQPLQWPYQLTILLLQCYIYLVSYYYIECITYFVPQFVCSDFCKYISQSLCLAEWQKGASFVASRFDILYPNEETLNYGNIETSKSTCLTLGLTNSIILSRIVNIIVILQ